jgi:hypothetical protein
VALPPLEKSVSWKPGSSSNSSLLRPAGSLTAPGSCSICRWPIGLGGGYGGRARRSRRFGHRGAPCSGSRCSCPLSGSASFARPTCLMPGAGPFRAPLPAPVMHFGCSMLLGPRRDSPSRARSMGGPSPLPGHLVSAPAATPDGYGDQRRAEACPAQDAKRGTARPLPLPRFPPGWPSGNGSQARQL